MYLCYGQIGKSYKILDVRWYIGSFGKSNVVIFSGNVLIIPSNLDPLHCQVLGTANLGSAHGRYNEWHPEFTIP